MRSIRLANILSSLSAGCAVFLVDRDIRAWLGVSIIRLPEAVAIVAVIAAAYTYLLLSHLGRFDPVVAWAASAWRKGHYESAILRLRLFSWGSGRAPFMAFLLTSANLADRAYAVAAKASLPETDIEDPTYNLDFALGRAALGQGRLDLARRHFDRLHERLPRSALARFALGDLLLWQSVEPERASELLTSALPDADRFSLPHWTRLGLEAELRASHAWSLGVTGKPEELQYSLDKAIALAGGNKPVRAAVHLRIGYALRALHRVTPARQHWAAARDIDPQGWAGRQAARELS